MSKRNLQRRAKERTALDRPVYKNVMINNALSKTTQLTNIYTRVLSDICMARFTWTGLPPSISERYLEATLHYNGLSIFYDNGVYGGFLALKGSPAGRLNMYDDPVEFVVYGNTFVNERVKAKDCVPIWANAVRRPDNDIVMYFASRFAALDQTIDINTMTQRHPFIVAADQNEIYSLQNAFNQIQEGQPVLWGFPNMLSPEALSQRVNVLNMGIHPDTIIKLQDTKSRIWNECMSMLGINNVNTDKRERMVTDEVNANNDQVDAVKRSALDARQQAAERINAKYDLHVSVDWNDISASEWSNNTISDGSGD